MITTNELVFIIWSRTLLETPKIYAENCNPQSSTWKSQAKKNYVKFGNRNSLNAAFSIDLIEKEGGRGGVNTRVPSPLYDFFYYIFKENRVRYAFNSVPHVTVTR